MLLIFDCDGVLIDSEWIANAVGAEAVTKMGYPIDTATFVRRFTGLTQREMWMMIEYDLGRSVTEAERVGVRNAIHRRFEDELKPLAHAPELLASLEVRKCVASSTRIEPLKRNLQLAGLLHLLDPHIFSASQVARGKPAPDVFLFAASQMGADPGECLIIEDSVAGATAARRAGMAVVGFTGGRHADADLGQRLTEAGAKRVIAHLSEIQDLITLFKADGAGALAAA